MRRFLAVAATAACACRAAVAGDLVSNYAEDMSRYPARVLCLDFASGTMDASHRIQFGYWTVHFGEATPVATPFKGSGPTDSFEIPLQCDNPELGTRDCTIEVVKRGSFTLACRITDGERVDFPVACPRSIAFAK